MYLDYSKLEFDKFGRPEVPDLVLKTLGGETLGILNYVYNLKLNVKLSEPSEMTFDIPARVDGVPNPLYESVTGRKIIYTKRYGIYVTMNPTTQADGIEDVKSVVAYSIEKRLDDKRFFLEEGTFNFWNPASPDNTLLGRIREIAPDWSVGYVSPGLIGRYRTFDSYDDYLLSFIYNTAPDKFRCVFVFDPYKMTINVYDADEERSTLPIYLDFDNLVESLDIEELSDELVTALRPYGADELDIRDVNPIGTNWIYDISYFIANGDIPDTLARKWEAWQRSVLNKQAYYNGLVGLRASATARLLTEQAALVDLQGELTDLTNQQSVTIQALAMETTNTGKQSQQQLLNEINAKISAKNAEITSKEADIASIQSELNDGSSSYNAQIQAIVDELSITNYFTAEEYAILREYFIEQDVTEETFVATDLDTSISGDVYTISGNSIRINNSTITKIDLSAEFSKQMYVVSGGSFNTNGNFSLSCDIIRGTLEVSSSNEYVLSLYAGEITVNTTTAPSGMITISGTLSGMTDDVQAVTENGITTLKGSSVQFTATSGSMYLTANVSDYQKYSVKMELFDYAASLLSDLATPTYEFSVDTGNFLFAQEFAPFRNNLELGRGVYLNIGGGQVITPYIIEFELDFEDRNEFSIIFSNRFKRHDNVNTLKDMIESSYSSGRSFDASKYIYNQTVGQASMVSQFMQSSLDATVNSIIAASNQTVIINGAGIHVGRDSGDQLRIINSMIAMSDDNWETAKLAIGRFATDSGTYFGVNAEVVGGKLIVGNNLIIENTNDNGVMQFKVDASGAWLYNSTFVLQTDSLTRATGGKIILDPKYGVIAGNGNLFSVNGTTVTPSFIDGSGNVVTDSDGIPTNANFFLDIRDGSAYFRGMVKAVGGSIGGWTLANDHLYSGSGSTYVALNASSSNNSLYAIWAGASNPASAPFWVKRNGDIYAVNGTFKGTIYGASYKDRYGNSMMNNSGQFTSDYLSLYGLTITDGNTVTFRVTANGKVEINGDITMGAGSVINWAQVTNQNITSNPAYNLASTANSNASYAYGLADSAWDKASNAESTAYSVDNNLTRLSNGQYYGGTFISGRAIYSPIFYASTNDTTTYGAFDGDSLTFYERGYQKISLDYGLVGTYGQYYAAVKLGNTSQAYIMKRYQNGSHQLWIGDVYQSCGILFDFSRRTYQFYGTEV